MIQRVFFCLSFKFSEIHLFILWRAKKFIFNGLRKLFISSLTLRRISFLLLKTNNLISCGTFSARNYCFFCKKLSKFKSISFIFIVSGVLECLWSWYNLTKPCLWRPYQLNVFTESLLQILLGPFLNILTHLL